VPKAIGPASHCAVRNGCPRSSAGRAEERQRLHEERPLRPLDAIGQAVQREGRRRDQAADESAARLVVAAQQQEHREKQQQRHQDPRGGAEHR
jgi:hypothetical protein